RALGVAAPVVLPHEVVEAVVEVIELEMLELGLRRAEQLLGELDVLVHGAADVHQHEHLDRIASLGPDRSNSSGAPCRANFLNLLKATFMLRVPSSTESSRLRYSRWSQTLAALRLRPFACPMRTPSGLWAYAPNGD